MAAYKITIEKVNSTESVTWFDNRVDLLIEENYFDRKMSDEVDETIRDFIKEKIDIEERNEHRN